MENASQWKMSCKLEEGSAKCCSQWKNKLKMTHFQTNGISNGQSSLYNIKIYHWLIWTLMLLVRHGTGATFKQSFSVPEDSVRGTVVGTVNLTSARDIKFFDYVSSPADPFSLELNGTISVTFELDRETKASYTYNGKADRDIYIITIDITDVNDNRPVFSLNSQGEQRFSVQENSQPGFKIAIGRVEDQDIGINSLKECEIINGNIDGVFLLNKNRQGSYWTLDLVVNSELDYEQVSSYSLVLRATDGGIPTLSSTVSIRIDVEDANDNTPMFPHSFYSAYVPEDASIGTSVLQVYANDTDSGKNGEVRYEIDEIRSEPEAVETFLINALTGKITVNKAMDYESNHRGYRLVIKAKDQAEVSPLEETTTVMINVTDVNDNTPEISIIFLGIAAGDNPRVGHVMENEPSSIRLIRISISDPDISSPSHSVSVLGGGSYFELVGGNTTWFLVASSPIDRETTPQFNLKIIAVDSGKPPLRSEEAIRIVVVDKNDNAPYFSQNVYNTDIHGLVSSGSSVLQLSAVDMDQGQNSEISYSILSTQPRNIDWFRIDQSTGLITTKTDVDCDTQIEPVLSVLAVDSGSPRLSGSTTVKIRIRHVNNNNPMFAQTSYNATIAENLANGSCILTVRADDPDCGGHLIQYSLSGDTPSEFHIHSSNGQICLKRPLDYETARLFQFAVIASDKDGYNSTARITVNVRDVNDNIPLFKQTGYSLDIRRDTEPGTIIGEVEAVDRDSGLFGTITYHVLSGNDQALFSVGATTGKVSLQHNIPASSSGYSLVIQARDGGDLTSNPNTVVRISVVDSSSAQPEFSLPYYTFSISEDAPRNTPVGTVIATSTAGAVTYKIVSDQSTSAFTIDQRTGEIKTASHLDHEGNAFVTLMIQAQVANPPVKAQAQVRIEIRDVNDNAPVFAASSSIVVMVPEDMPVGTVIYDAIALDLDSDEYGRITYQLQDPTHKFQIDPRDGKVRLLNAVNYEVQTQHHLLVMASDGGSPPKSSQLTIFVNIQDINDNPPRFEQQQYRFRILENSPLNSVIGQLSASDLDSGNNGKISYMVQGTEAFTIGTDSGVLRNRVILDRETKASYVLQVMAVDSGIPALSAIVQVTVNVDDVNDNSPKFVNMPYVFSLAENRPPHTGVGFVKATDWDDSAKILYSIQPISSYFSIDRNSGEIITSKQLDRELQDSHSLTVVVSDGGSPSISTSTVVTVIVMDMNDNSPVFSKTGHYTARIKEKKPIGTSVTSVQATDRDKDDNGTITYSLLSDDHNLDWKLFRIDIHNGQITTNEILDHEAKSLYVFNVVARDGGFPSRSSLATVEIIVEDENEGPPVFIKSFESFNVMENTLPGTIIGYVEARDTDIHSKVYYYIVSGNLYSTFGVNKTTGAIYIAKPVDFEQCSLYSLQIMAVDSDPNNPQDSTISVNITIMDINDNAPTFESNPVIVSGVSENIQTDEHIATLVAIDLDSGPLGAIFYSIESQSPNGQWVKINENTGFVYTASAFDYEITQEISVVVKATNKKINNDPPLFSTITLLILVEDENDNLPIIQSPSAVILLEDEPVGYPVVHIIATDKDSGLNGDVSYAITSGNEHGNFHLDTKTGLLTIAKMLDRETMAAYNLQLHVYDAGSPPMTSQTELAITLVDVNDNPPVFQKSVYFVNITEGNSPNFFVTQVSATDADEGINALLEYIIPSGTENEIFHINNQTGQLYCMMELDRESQTFWKVTVYVKDNGFPALYDTAEVRITVIDMNDNAPIFHENSYFMEVPENSQSIIHTVKATDPDLGLNGQIAYTIIAGDPEGKFILNSLTGELSCRPLDREKTSSYNLTIKAEDSGSLPHLSSLTFVRINVLDVNDNDPKFINTPYRTSIPEDAPVNTSVLTVQATDDDDPNSVNSVISYSINNSAHGLFKIDNVTGLILTTGTFDREKMASYIFEVYAIDGGLYGPRSRSNRVEITITDINDNAPIFTEVPYKAEIGQDFAPNGIVTSVRATDLDIGQNGLIRYKLVNPDSYFLVDPVSGDIRTKTTLTDPIAVKVHRVQILATDQALTSPKQSIGLVDITVGSVVSKGSLIFSSTTYNASVNENSPRGTPVTSVRAMRAETNVFYAFASGNEKNAFQIDGATGVITVNDPTQIDYESESRMRLIVVATSTGTDGGYVPVWITVNDVNDNYPIFTQDRYTSSVWEGNSRRTYVTQVIATDLDSGDNGRIEYFVISGDMNAFTIDPPHTGVVMTNTVLDREITSSYKLIIEARDGGIPPKTSTCVLKIQVVDENDNVPFFRQYNPVTLKEGTEPGSEVTTVTASDLDLSPALTYMFSQPSDMFSIDTFSGRITTARKIDYEIQTKYTLIVMASDTKSNHSTDIVIAIQDENDNPPIFPKVTYEVNIPELTGPQTPIITVTATDADSMDNALIAYSMLPMDGYYINSNTGTIYTNKTIMYSSSQPLHLIVTAQDHGTPPLSAVVPVVVKVIDINNNAPIFSAGNKIFELAENAAKGHLILTMTATDADSMADNKKVDYSIVSGDHEDVFDIKQSSGELLVVGDLDHERNKQYFLTIMARDRGTPPLSSTVNITINILDINDNPPVFEYSEYITSIAESALEQSNIIQVQATDNDSGLNGLVHYYIMSGNDYNNFEINLESGWITVKTLLDHEKADLQRLIIKAVDLSLTPQSAFCTVMINITDVNEFYPDFPQYMYLEEVMELSDVGTPVFTAQANDKDTGFYGLLTYSLHNDVEYFTINAQTGIVSTTAVLNYSEENQYSFHVEARDSGGLKSQVPVVVAVLPLVKPKFTEMSYNFKVPGNAKVNYAIGQVAAYDINGKPSSLIKYTLKEASEYFAVNSSSGVIFVIKDLKSGEETRQRREVFLARHRRALIESNVTLIVVASGGNPNVFPTAETVIIIEIDRTCVGCAVQPEKPSLNTTALGLIIAFVIVAVILGIVILVMCLRGRDRKSGVRNQQDQYDSSSFETMDIPPMHGNFAPPPYNESNSFARLHQHNLTTSEISDQSHSASSGRGSAEGDEVDEEIQRITDIHAPLNLLRMPDSGIQHDDDAMSEHSVHNHQEYLQRLGIDTSKFKINTSEPTTIKSGITSSVESMHQFSDEGGGEGHGMDIDNLVYSKLDQVKANEDLATMDGTKQYQYDHDKSNGGSLSSVINSEEEFSGSYNWDYLLDWGPQYQPLAAVFMEIAKLKDDAVKPKTKPTQIVPQRPSGLMVQQGRMGGPPPMITDTPPKGIPLSSGLLSTSHPSHSQSSLQSGSSRGTSSARTSQLTNISLPKSPLSYESSFTSPAMSPSFTPSLSPLATRSPSISPLMTPKGYGSGHSSGHLTPAYSERRGLMMVNGSSGSEQEIQI